MKHKLKKDFGNHKAGDTFSRACIELQSSITTDDSEWFESVEDEPKRWRAKRGGEYWYVAADGEVCEEEDIGYGDNDDNMDASNYRFGNYFRTRKQAEKMAETMGALLKFVHNEGDWSAMSDLADKTAVIIENDI